MRQPSGKRIIARNTAVSLLILGAVAILIYANTFHAPFVFDDGINITDNPRIRMTELSWVGIADVLKGWSANRPFPYLTIALNYFFHQYQVTGYHVVNLLIHIITAILVYFLTRQTLALCQKEAPYLPFLAALLWLVNPLHTQSVTYIIQRMNSLAAMFYLLAMVCYIQARRFQLSVNRGGLRPETRAGMLRPGSRQRQTTAASFFLFAAAVISGVLALASKEIAVTLPILIFVYEWYFFQGLSRAWLKQKIKWLGGGAIVIVIVAFIYLDANPVQKILSTYEHQPFTPGQRLLSQPRVIIYYISLMTFPHPQRLNLDYAFPVSGTLFELIATGLSLLALIALTVLAVFVARKHRLVSFAIFWFLGTLSIESSVLGLALIYEHRTYLSSVFPFIAATWCLLRHVRPRAAAIAAIISAVILCGIWTWQRNYVWQDKIRFWQDAVAKTPFKSSGYRSLGIALQDAGDYQQALACFEQALRFGKIELYDFTSADIGAALVKSGRFQEAIPYLEKVVARNARDESTDDRLNLALPTDPWSVYRVRALYKKAYVDLGIALQQSGRISDAIQHYRYALGIDPQMTNVWNNMGNGFFSQGNIDQARACFEKALAIDPGYEQAGVNLKKIETIMNQYGADMRRLETEAGRQPDNALISYQLGRVYQAAGMTDKAIRQYHNTLAVNPGMIQGLNALATLYADTRQLRKATEVMARLTELLPDNPTVFYNLACLYARQDEVDQAVGALRRAVEKGYDRWSHLASDRDLDNIRQTSYYRELMAVTPQ